MPIKPVFIDGESVRPDSLRLIAAEVRTASAKVAQSNLAAKAGDQLTAQAQTVEALRGLHRIGLAVDALLGDAEARTEIGLRVRGKVGRPPKAKPIDDEGGE